jgi:natural product biosynthesis luciferase-like monooxygenase protein
MLDFSLFFFSSYNVKSENKYQLLLDAVKYADSAGFSAVWTPERHFHEFGGLFPNPSVISAALAMITKKVELRSGSIVSPLHDSIRVAEEWSVVDNLSRGRVALSFASGWNAHDFALASDNFTDRHRIMYDQIDTISNLWKGNSIKRINGLGKEIEVRIFPTPIQKELPIWITAAGNENTYIAAGEKGFNLLTHLLGQDIQELADKIALYREARVRKGYAADQGKVALMLHTYLGDDIGEVERIVERPFMDYLRSATSLSRFIYEEAGYDPDEIPEEFREEMLRHSVLRYVKTAALIGTRASCMALLSKLKDIGVDEIACLVDFGVEEHLVIQSLRKLKELHDDIHENVRQQKEQINYSFKN